VLLLFERARVWVRKETFLNPPGAWRVGFVVSTLTGSAAAKGFSIGFSPGQESSKDF
jgi:hypothetical protein